MIHNYRSRKSYQPREVNLTFEKQASADQLWLEEVENAAKAALQKGVYKTVEEVAAATGYSSGSYLTKSFQERFGKKPGEYL